MLRNTFQLVRGVGRGRERRLWEAGVTDWSHFASAALALPASVRETLARALDDAEGALARDDLPALAAAIPTTEHWRLFAAFADRAVYLDIETDFEGVTVVGLLDGDGPRLLFGDDIARLPEAVPPDCLL